MSACRLCARVRDLSERERERAERKRKNSGLEYYLINDIYDLCEGRTRWAGISEALYKRCDDIILSSEIIIFTTIITTKAFLSVLRLKRFLNNLESSSFVCRAPQDLQWRASGAWRFSSLQVWFKSQVAPTLF